MQEDNNTNKSPLKIKFIRLIQAALLIYILISAYLLFALYTRVSIVEAEIFPQPKYSVESLTTIAEDLGLDSKKFKKCLVDEKKLLAVQKDYESGINLGINGTPAVIYLDLVNKQAFKIGLGAGLFDSYKTVIDAIRSGKSIDQINEDYIKTSELQGIKNSAGVISPITTKVEVLLTDKIRGSSDANFALIEYSDLECPYCAKFHPEMNQLVKEYQTDMIWVYKHFPLPFHPEAQKLAEATECAKEQGGIGAFWKMVDKIFETHNQ